MFRFDDHSAFLNMQPRLSEETQIDCELGITLSEDKVSE